MNERLLVGRLDILVNDDANGFVVDHVVDALCVAATGHEVNDIGAQLRERGVLERVSGLGEKRRVRHTRGDIRVDEPAGSLVVNHEVHAGQVAQAQRRVGLDGCGL